MRTGGRGGGLPLTDGFGGHVSLRCTPADKLSVLLQLVPSANAGAGLGMILPPRHAEEETGEYERSAEGGTGGTAAMSCEDAPRRGGIGRLPEAIAALSGETSVVSALRARMRPPPPAAAGGGGATAASEGTHGRHDVATVVVAAARTEN